jgi:hypothetical protein
MVFAADEDQLPSLAAAKAAALKQKEEALEGLPEPAAVDPAVKEQEERKVGCSGWGAWRLAPGHLCMQRRVATGACAPCAPVRAAWLQREAQAAQCS